MNPLASLEIPMIRTRSHVTALVLALGLALAPALAHAQTPGTAPAFLPVQGYLTDATGQPVDGQTDLTLSLYTTATGGTAVYQETQTVMVDHGFFTVYLGQNTPLDLSVFRDDPATFLGIQVGTDAEMSPRLVLGSTPYAAYAQYAGDAASVGGIPASQLMTSGQGVHWTDIQNRPAGLDDGDDDTTYTTASPLTLNASANNRIGLMSCASGQVLKAGAGGWGCAADATGITSETDPTVNALARASLSCATGQVPKWGGSSWSCQADLDTTRTNADLRSTLDPRYVNVAGDSMTGPLTVDGRSGGGLAVTVTGNASGSVGQNAALSVTNSGISTTASETAIAGSATSGGVIAAGVTGQAGNASSSFAYGVDGVATKAGTNVGGNFFASGGQNAYGIMAQASGGTSTSYAGYFKGDVMVQNGRYRYAQPVTGTLNVSPVDCKVHSGTVSSNGMNAYVTSGIGTLYCPIHVPNGVTVTNLTCHVFDNNPSGSVSLVFFWSADDAGSGSILASMRTTTESTAAQTLSQTVTAGMDNATHRLLFYVNLDGSSEAFRSCTITYEESQVQP